MVGLGRFELPTSPLSGVRSNQLSYRPLLRVGPNRFGPPQPSRTGGYNNLLEVNLVELVRIELTTS